MAASKRRWSLSTRILVGLLLGAALGLFVGDYASVLQPVADIYLRLMQMTVLPYLLLSLLCAFGELDLEEARMLAVRGGVLLLMVWGLTGLVLFVLPWTFPPFDSAQFFSHALVEPREPLDLAELFFTDNFFASLSNNVVPAVVLFSCLLGVGLMTLPDKERLLTPLEVANQAVVRVTQMVVELTPIGVFALGAVAAGTMDPALLGRLEVYLVAFGVAALLLAFWILPLLVTAVTPFRYREVAGIARDALITAFAANNAFIVLPILVERSKKLLQRHDLLGESADSAAEVMIPVMFNFPNAGKLLTLLFVPFAAWLSGAPLALRDFGTLFGVGIPSYFAKAQATLPSLLDIFGLPHDLFQLYLPTAVITGKFDSMVTAMNLLVFALLGAGALGGFLVFDRRRIARAALGIAGGVGVAFVALRLFFAAAIDTDYRLDDAVRHMQEASREAGTIVRRDSGLDSVGAVPATPGDVAAIRARGTLRIGYDPDNLPMSFFNDQGELVGFDVDVSERLAKALGVRAEFVPVRWPEVSAMLADGRIDVMPGVWVRPYWFSRLRLTMPYFTATMGLAVPDERRYEFDTVAELRRSSGLRVGVPLDTAQIAYSMERYFGGSDVEFVPVEFWKPYFEGEVPGVDAFLLPAEHASGWTLLHPEYSVVVPQPDPVLVPSAFGVAPGADELARLIDEWIVYAENAGMVREDFEYWVTGQGARSKEPRWSILRDVLGWVD